MVQKWADMTATILVASKVIVQVMMVLKTVRGYMAESSVASRAPISALVMAF